MPFEQTFAMRLRAAYLTLHRRFNSHFAERGATADQFVLLCLLAENPGITQSQLGALSASDPNTITAMLRVLIRRDLVRREAHAQDGRARCVHLTPQGRVLHRKLVKYSATLHQQLEATVKGHDQVRIQATLDRITRTMASPPPDRPGHSR